MDILLAEDNEVNRKLAVRVLQRRGHTVSVAVNGRDAVDMIARRTAQARPFDLVLMDVQMPEMGGMEATAAVRERERSDGDMHHQRIVAMTALVMTGDRERCLSAGMDDYISKPFRPEDLDSVLERCLGHKRTSVEGRKASSISGTRRIVADAATTPAHRETLDTNDLMARVGNDVDLVLELSHILGDDAPVKLRGLREAFAIHDTVTFRAIAHSLKGALAVLSARRAAAQAAELERIGRAGELHGADALVDLLEREILLVQTELTTILRHAVRGGGGIVKILVADDDRTSLLVMRSMLRRSGYDVVTAKDGAEATQILAHKDAPRLVLLDWMMPGLRGPEVCQSIRSLKDRPYTYVMLLTSRDTKDDLVQGLQAGADDYITKPCHPEELDARLRTGVRILQLEDSLIHARDEMHFRAMHDALTRLPNRGAAVAALHTALQGAADRAEWVSVVLGDVDHFKDINDTYGHPAGDQVLREVARRTREAVRSTNHGNADDTVGRFGGEEFLIVLRHTDAASAADRAEAARAAIAQTFVRTHRDMLPVTMSLGALSIAPGTIRDGDEALRRADDLLYAAKNGGRNRVVSGVAGHRSSEHAPVSRSHRQARPHTIAVERPSRARERFRG